MNPEKKILRRMGYLNDQQGIINRYMSETENWNNHLQQSKNFIKHRIATGNFRSLAILGSGWLLDVPMDYMLENAETIYLVDVFHPRQIRHQYRSCPQIHWIEDDITGGLIQQVYDFARQKKNMTDSALNELNPVEYNFSFPQPDLIVSLNLLNQLDILLVDYLLSKKEFSEQAVLLFRKKIQQQHVHFLQQHNALLISDVREQKLHLKTGRKEEKPLIFADLPQTSGSKKWQWKFDTKGNYYNDYQTFFEVNAINISK